MEKTYGMIKPDCVRAGKADSVLAMAEAAGFVIVAKQQVQLSKEKAGLFYAEHKGKPFYDNLVTFMSSGPVVALCLAKPDAILGWRALLGPTNSLTAKEEAPNSIRGMFGTDGTQNAAHGSDSPESAKRELKFFFPKLVVDPVPTAEEAREFIATKLQPTLVKGLTVLCKEKPSAGKMEAITWLAHWLKENNPYQANSYAEADLPLEEDPTEEELLEAELTVAATDTLEGIEDLESQMAATKLQANFRGYKARKQVSGMKASTGGMEASMVVIESHTQEADENAAAVKLQATYKGHMGRKKVKGLKEQKAKEDAEMAGAATKVQASFRGHQARKEVKSKKEGAETVMPVIAKEEEA